MLNNLTEPRLHRLPIRTDYVLIPAPLDLSLPEIAQKSPLPPIIVTPCDPSSTQDFSLAFLPNPPKPSLRERIQRSFSSPSPSPSTWGTGAGASPLSFGAQDEPKLFPINFSSHSHSRSLSETTSSPNRTNRGTLRTRSILAILLVSFLALCHIITHRLAVRMNRPYIDVAFAVQGAGAGGVAGVHDTYVLGVAHAHSNGGVLGSSAPVNVQGHDIHPGYGLGKGGMPGPMISNWFRFRSSSSVTSSEAASAVEGDLEVEVKQAEKGVESVVPDVGAGATTASEETSP
ncbi:hypothetical protein CPB83DRAFT_194863 [Crepidotus variabilis]|uniref:Uncharacterized protein n=1 Tax=Crepidotus variabilis TaxID=179855 RepID=A0A9P6E360_9AGAR|nr:hypothetical protein CPB83DRAFT_194863 [Crepidotus variabilis]